MQSPSSTSSFSRVATVFALALGVFQLLLAAIGTPSEFFHSELTAWQYEKARRLDRESGIDLIAMGNSQINVGFDAALFREWSGLESFNFALDGADVIAQATYLREIVVPSFRPTRVLWGISPRDLNANPDYREHTNHDRILEGIALRTAALPQGWRVIPLVKDLLPFHRRSWTDWCAFFWHRIGGGRRPLDDRGFRARTGHYQPEPFRQASSGFYYEAIFSPEWLATLEETFEELRERGVDLRVVTAPVHHNTLGMFDPVKLDQAIRHIGVIADHEGIPYRNWMEHAEFADAALYHDAIHLNTRGAERFTRMLAEEFSGSPGPTRSTAALR